MANIKVSELPTTTNLNDEDYFMVVQNNANKKMEASNLIDTLNSDALSVGDIVYSGDISATGSYDLTKNISNYRFIIVELTTGTASVRSYFVLPGYKLIGDNAMWITSNIDEVVRGARIQFYPTQINVLAIPVNSYSHIRSIRAIK